MPSRVTGVLQGCCADCACVPGPSFRAVDQEQGAALGAAVRLARGQRPRGLLQGSPTGVDQDSWSLPHLHRASLAQAGELRVRSGQPAAPLLQPAPHRRPRAGCLWLAPRSAACCHLRARPPVVGSLPNTGTNSCRTGSATPDTRPLHARTLKAVGAAAAATRVPFPMLGPAPEPGHKESWAQRSGAARAACGVLLLPARWQHAPGARRGTRQAARSAQAAA